MFVDREAEFDFLNSILKRTRPTAAQLLLLYGRRRVGKTVLARRWAEAAGIPHIYWAAEKEPAALQRRKLFARALDMPFAQAASFDSWTDLWQALANIWQDRQQIFILDEVAYAAEADPAFLSSLQHAWDQRFKHSKSVILLSGSHVHTMETLLARGSPLFGRFTGQWHLQPLPFETLSQFFPKWPIDQRVAAYAIVGGIPAYLEWLEPEQSLSDNLRNIILSPGSLFIAEPQLLLYDEVRDPRAHMAILQAIGAGAHTQGEIVNLALIGATHISSYLARLRELRLVERRLPVTIPPPAQRRSRKGRYHLSDAYFRFYFRFIAPHRDDLGYRPENVLPGIQEQLRAFVGQTAFEELCRTWVIRQSLAGKLPIEVKHVGSHWDRRVQVDVVGINWQTKAVLAGESKWGANKIGRDTLRELVEQKQPKLLAALPAAGEKWQLHLVAFGRAGFTKAARRYAAEHNIQLVDLPQLDADLGRPVRAG